MPREIEPRPVFIPKGQDISFVLEGGVAIRIKNPAAPDSSFTLEQKSLDPREAQRAQLKAKFPNILFSITRGRLNQHGITVTGGEQASNDMDLLESQYQLTAWMQEAKRLGITIEDILDDTKALLKQVMIGSTRMGQPSSLIKGIGTEIEDVANEVWRVKRKPNSKKVK